jgi:AraC family transcriptional regulator, transcriptional activator of the genes for pyochelin and ferripyochelin receptors
MIVKSRSENWLVNGVKIAYHESGSSIPAEVDWPIVRGGITLMFCFSGKLSIGINRMPGVWELSDNLHNIYFTTEDDRITSEGGMEVKWLSVQFSKKAFLSLADTTDIFVKQFVDQIMAGQPTQLSDYPLPIDMVMLSCIHSILNCNYPDSLKRMFVFSKAVELFVLQTESCGRSTGREVTWLKKEYDRERILFARDYLVKHVENPPALAELARLAGINEFKLKNGFKEIFNQPVFAYLADYRLETARNELMKRSKTITEIAFELGFSSPQHFSSAFKKKYGVQPGKIG